MLFIEDQNPLWIYFFSTKILHKQKKENFYNLTVHVQKCHK